MVMATITLFAGPYLSQHDDHLHMFTVADPEAEVIDECGMYPALEETLENFTTDDVESDGSREPICNYEWADDIDVINVLHGVSEWPVALQVRYFDISKSILYFTIEVELYLSGSGGQLQ